MASYLDKGVDYSYARPRPSGLYAAGYRFVARYLAPQSAKRLTIRERDALWKAGLGIYLVWENRADDMLDGAAGGKADATEARRQARALGFPSDYPIFHAADEDYSLSRLQGPITAYCKAAAKVHGGIAHFGVYGGIRTVNYVANHHLASYFWQTYAWSNGDWDARAQLQQYHNGVVVAGGEVDLCRATTDKGRWTMPLSSADKSWITKTIKDAINAAAPNIAHVVWHKAELADPTGHGAAVSGANAVETSRNQAIAANGGIQQANATLAEIVAGGGAGVVGAAGTNGATSTAVAVPPDSTVNDLLAPAVPAAVPAQPSAADKSTSKAAKSATKPASKPAKSAVKSTAKSAVKSTKSAAKSGTKTAAKVGAQRKSGKG